LKEGWDENNGTSLKLIPWKFAWWKRFY
jgi:hypothetical protein